MYLKDITQIRDEKKFFVVVSPARTMSLEAQSQAEHVLWLNSLMNCSPVAGAKNGEHLLLFIYESSSHSLVKFDKEKAIQHSQRPK